MGDASQEAAEAGDALVVIGIGASAGGLEAIFELLDAIPAEPGFAVVIVTHQLAGRASLLPELLRHHTGMGVVLVSERITMRPNHVYLPPPGSTFAVDSDALEPRAPPLEGPRFPIDAFFRSLADAKGHLAVGVVLSGTGTDGTLGLTAIKAAGGLTLAQSVDSASHSGMPTSARLAGAVDESATPARIAPRLVEHAQRWSSAVESDEALGPTLDQVISLIRDRRGKDFSNYKPSTLRRRILRRFAIHGVASPPSTSASSRPIQTSWTSWSRSS